VIGDVKTDKQQSFNFEMSSSDHEDDKVLIEKAEEEASNERLIEAGRLLKKVKDDSLLEKKHTTMIRWAEAVEQAMNDILSPPDEKGTEWKKQGETHGDRDFLVYYKVNKDNQLSCRIDCAVESSLLVPLISVFNESDLYKTWMPSYKRPVKLGIRETKMLKESGRGNQTILVTIDMAWPMCARETVMHAVAVDMIEEKSAIAILAQSETAEDDPIIPEPLPSHVRVDFENGILIRGCPVDHPCLINSKKNYPENEELIMISLAMTVDAHVKFVPKRVINFVTRTVIGRLWSSTLKVAEDIRDGKRTKHQEAIREKIDLYGWIEERTQVMFDKLKEDR